MWKTTQITSIALCLASCFLIPNTFANEAEVDPYLKPSAVALEDIAKYTLIVDTYTSGVEDIIDNQAKAIVEESEIKSTISEMSFSDLNDEIVNNFVESIEVTKDSPVQVLVHPEGARNKSFAWGYCTYYVAQNKYVTWGGNAKDWYRNAQAKGVPTGTTPVAGAIVVFKPGYGHHPVYGHVGIVEKVNNDGTILISEMNAKWLGVVSTRKVQLNHKILGYIYVE